MRANEMILWGVLMASPFVAGMAIMLVIGLRWGKSKKEAEIVRLKVEITKLQNDHVIANWVRSFKNLEATLDAFNRIAEMCNDQKRPTDAV